MTQRSGVLRGGVGSASPTLDGIRDDLDVRARRVVGATRRVIVPQQGSGMGGTPFRRQPLSRPPLATVDTVVRGEHRERTPLYGVLMIIGAMVSAAIVYSLSVPAWLRLVVYVLDVPVAICGFLFTFRDLG